MKDGEIMHGEERGAAQADASPPGDALFAERGLSDGEVRERIAQGKTNLVADKSSRSYGSIIRANVFNRFNALLGALAVVVIIIGPIRDALFAGVLVFNTLIGVLQELRAKRTLDRLSLLSAPGARVVRDGAGMEIARDEVVLDDLLELVAGDQVLVDGEVLFSEGLEVDESLLTGESVPIVKMEGDGLLSGSFVSAGAGRFRATAVGEDAYAQKIASEARRYALVKSDLRDAINTILRYITYIMIPTAILLATSQFLADNTFDDSIIATVAGLVGMVPEGLVLLTSLVFAVSAMALARQNVLVQELPAVEGLARVDVICLDKTGTLTEGTPQFGRIEPLDGSSGLDEVLGAFAAASPAENSTMRAISTAFPSPPDWRVAATVPFSSARKWSAVSFEGHGSWVMGAPEVLLRDSLDREMRERADSLARSGLRVLLLSRVEEAVTQEELPPRLEHTALLVIEEKIRPDAADTLEYFMDQGVGIRVISGDNPRTVGAVAERVGVPGADAPVDARKLPTELDGLSDVMHDRTVFGRVVPEQKRMMVHALQSDGHVVAMTGDGVNDTLALKDADMGIAMGSGAPSTKSVAQLVLLDGRFSTLPRVVAEGRRVMANMERVANLFLTKTVYAALLAIGIAIIAWPYPFLPRHISLVGSLTIGIPAFVLSFAPSKKRYRPGLLRRVLYFAVPAGFIAAAATFTANAMARAHGASLEESRTVAVIVLTIVGLAVLAYLSRPMFSWRGALVAVMSGSFVGVLAIPWFRDFFQLDLPGLIVMLQSLAIAALFSLLLELSVRYMMRYIRGSGEAPPAVEEMDEVETTAPVGMGEGE
ncbi:MAG: HAD-IC family P-type ATPase [Actinomycetota bacterium]|nr:HAD-IC family P-type ATPase [Actinomycetota bacterium]MDD5666938.1 HAD-IC family P-type ATPase [Actinomycetota bacterium]